MNRKAVFGLLVVGIAIGAVVALGLLRGGGAARPDAAAIEENNRGVGLMGQYEYDSAREIFAGLVARYPNWNDVRVNEAIALLNRQEEQDSETALAMLEAVLEVDPGNARAQYCTGLLRLYLESPDAALPQFERVAEKDPRDAYAAYYTGQCRFQLQEFDEAVRWYERAVEEDPYLRSAYYGLSQAYQRVGRPDDAKAMLEIFQEMENNPRGKLVQFIYTRMGTKGEALAMGQADAAPAPRPEGSLFADAAALAPAGAEGSWGAVSAADLDGDGAIDLYFGGETTAAVLFNDGSNGFRVEPGHALATVTAVRAALFGDYDNDGLTDAYLCRRGPNQLWRQAPEGRWTDVTDATLVAGAALDTVDGAFFDADHDGDLDLFCVNGNGPDELFSNNLDGTFRPLGASHGLSGGARASRGVVVTDLDGDRDLDLVVVHAEPPHAVYRNDRLWAYEPAAGFDAFRAAAMVGAVAADVDADGRPELYSIDAAGAVGRWTRGTDGAWSGATAFTAPGDCPREQLTFVDTDGDGVLDPIVASSCGWTVLDAAGTARFAAADGAGPIAPVVLDVGAGPAIVGRTAGGAPALWGPGPGRHAFAGLAFSGADDKATSMRSNASGIGVRVAARVASRWTIFDTIRSGSGPGQSLQPYAIGLAGHPRIDFVSLDWPDGVLQTEIHGVASTVNEPPREFSARRLERVREIQRVTSSCPVLFAWDGTKYRFVSDLLGVGGIGFLVAPGEYGAPRPWERFLLPEDLPVPRNGRYSMKIGEPMEEACYLDVARLVAYDLPPGWSMTLDERMAIEGPEPTGRPCFYREQSVPVRAFNDRGEVVTDAVARADGVAAPVGPLDRRFLGRLAAPHAVTLEFDPIRVPPGAAPRLIAEGWIEYPYSQTMFSAWQAGAEYLAPTIEYRGPDGRWRQGLEHFGYPAGMPREMSVPLPDLPDGTTALRLTTNQEIYWDRFAVAWTEPCPDAVRRELPLVGASLAVTGFALRTDSPQRRPDYDHDRRAALWDTRHQRGHYTALGPVDELLDAVDDALAIFGPGEEIDLAFDADLPRLPDGWTRRFVLETEGWCKDMDLYTKDGATLGPLPSRGTPSERARALNEAYNTRFRSGRD